MVGRLKIAGLFFALAFLFLGRTWGAGQTHYPADILAAYPLFYDGVHKVHNYDLIDVINIFYPQSLLYHQGLQEGKLASWDPYTFGGHNLLANGHSGFFYPLRYLTHLAVPMPWAHDLFLWIHLGMAGTFFCWLLMELDLSTRSAILGAVAYQFNGFTMGWLEHEHVVTYAAWIPLCLWLSRLSFKEQQQRARHRLMLLVAVPLGVVGMVGMMQYWAYTLILVAVWGAVQWLRTRPLVWPDFFTLVSSWVLAIMLCAVNLMPILNGLEDSARQVIPWQYQTAAFRQVLLSLPLSLVLPDYAGNPVGGFHMQRVSVGGNWIYPETCFYVGLIPLALAALSGSFRKRWEWRFFALFPVGLMLVCSTPLFALFHSTLPGFKQTIVTRFLFVLPLSLSVLAAFGWQSLEQHEGQGKRLRNGLAGLFGLLVALYGAMLSAKFAWFSAWFNSGLIRLPDPAVTPNFPVAAQQAFDSFFSLSNPTFWAPLLILVVAVAALSIPLRGQALWGLLLVITILDPAYKGWLFNSTCEPSALYPARPEIAFLKDKPGRVLSLGCVRPNTFSVYHLRGLEGDESLYPEATRLFADALARRPFHGPGAFKEKIFPVRELQQNLVNMADIRWLVVHPAQTAPPPWKEVFKAQLRIYENPQVWPEAYWTHDIITDRVPEGAVTNTLRLKDFKDGAVVHDDDFHEPLELKVDTHALEVTREGPTTIKVRGPLYDGWLVLAEAFDPGWRAEEDGRGVTVMQGNGMFMACHVEKGQEVVFTFEPSIWFGRFLTYLSLIVLGVWVGGLSLRVKRA